MPKGAKAGVDLRSLPKQGQRKGQGGFGLFAFDGGTTQVKSGTFVTSDDDAALRYVEDWLTTKSDPEGLTGPMPLMPKRNGNLEINFNGLKTKRKIDYDDAHGRKVKKVWRKAFDGMDKETGRRFLGAVEKFYGVNPVPEVEPLEPHTTITESFNKSDGALGPDLSWTVTQGNLTVESNEWRGDNSANGFARADSDLSSTDHYAQATVATMNIFGGEGGVGTNVRMANSGVTHYGCIAYKDMISSYRIIWKWVSGSRTDLTSNTTALPSVPFSIKLVVSGSNLEYFVGGTSTLTTTDTAITTGTRCGIYAYQFGTVQCRGDAFEAGDNSAPATSTKRVIII